MKKKEVNKINNRRVEQQKKRANVWNFAYIYVCVFCFNLTLSALLLAAAAAASSHCKSF